MPIYKNPIIVQENQSKSLITYKTGSSTYSKTEAAVNGQYIRNNTYYAHGIAMKDEQTDFSVNMTDAESFRVGTRFKYRILPTSSSSSRYAILFGSQGHHDNEEYTTPMYNGPNNAFIVEYRDKSDTTYSGLSLGNSWIQTDTWYYYVSYFKKGIGLFCSVYTDSGELIVNKFTSKLKTPVNTAPIFCIGGVLSNTDTTANDVDIDIASTFVEKNGALLWGTTDAKTKNMGIFYFDNWNEFTEVDYLQSTGKQYILTDFYIESSDKIITKNAIMSNLPSTQCIFCARGMGTTDKTKTIFSINGQWRADFQGTGEPYGSIPTNQFQTLIFDNNKFYVDGQLAQTFQASTFTSGGFLSLFASYNRTSSEYTANSWGNYSYAKQGILEIRSNINLLKHDLHPCVHKITGTPGLFDKVTNKFYINNGTGDFIIPKNFEEYQEVEWIKSTGTQYIDTSLSKIDGYEVKFNYESLTSNNSILGERQNNSNNRIGLSLYSSQFYVMPPGSKIEAWNKDIHTIAYGSQTNWIAKLDGENKYTYSGQYSSINSVHLFGENSSGSINRSSSVIYYAKLYSNGTLVGHFIPCYNKKSGEIGMFNIITNTFHSNIGTGTFTCGPDVIT